MEKLWDAIVIGAGPAGASCAVWLKQLGFYPLLLEAHEAPGGLLRTNSYLDVWTLTNPDMTGQEMAQSLVRQLQVAEVVTVCNQMVEQVSLGSSGFVVKTASSMFLARHVVIASGVVARHAAGMAADERYSGVLVGPGEHIMTHDFNGLSVAVLGGGDNAFENALFARAQGARHVHIFARSVRAQHRFVSQVPAQDVVLGAVEFDPAARRVNGRVYDRVLVLYGWQPRVDFLQNLSVARDARGFLQVDPMTAQTTVPGLYAIGEVTQRMHPCVPTAMADGVVAAKAIERLLQCASS